MSVYLLYTANINQLNKLNLVDFVVHNITNMLCFFAPVCLFVFVYQQDYVKTTEQSPMKVGIIMGHRPRQNRLNFGVDRDRGMDPGIFFTTLFLHGEIGCLLTLSNDFPGKNARILMGKKKPGIFMGLITMSVRSMVRLD